MLGRDPIGELEGLLEIATTTSAPRLLEHAPDRVGARQICERAIERRRDRDRRVARDGRQQHRGLVAGAMLGLRDQVGGDPFGMRAVVGDHQHLARPRHLVDID